MSRRPARCTEADIKRAVKAARAGGPDMAVRILPDGTIEIFRRVPDAPAHERVEPGRTLVF